MRALQCCVLGTTFHITVRIENTSAVVVFHTKKRISVAAWAHRFVCCLPDGCFMYYALPTRMLCVATRLTWSCLSSTGNVAHHVQGRQRNDVPSAPVAKGFKAQKQENKARKKNAGIHDRPGITIAIDGEWYDVEKWAKHHPGGQWRSGIVVTGLACTMPHAGLRLPFTNMHLASSPCKPFELKNLVRTCARRDEYPEGVQWRGRDGSLPLAALEGCPEKAKAHAVRVSFCNCKACHAMCLESGISSVWRCVCAPRCGMLYGPLWCDWH